MNNEILLNVINEKYNQPVIYRNELCKLRVSLKNETGTDIELRTGKSSLQLSFSEFSADEIKRIILTSASGDWTPAEDGTLLKLVYSGEDNAKWRNKEELICFAGQVQTVAQPSTAIMRVNLRGFPIDVPMLVTTPFAILNPAIEGNGDLKKVLQPSLDNNGTVYVSLPGKEGILDEFENTLFLNLKNTGTKPLFHGEKKGVSSSARIEVSFIYGGGSGCLTPIDKAWDIKAAIRYQSESYPWQAKNPSETSGDPFPKWILQPGSTNSGLIGTGENANVTIDFSAIIAATPPGHTQVLLHFTGFMQDDETPYDDEVFVLDIHKEECPAAARGIIRFYPLKSSFTVDNLSTPLSVELRWISFHTAKVHIKIEGDGILIQEETKIDPESRRWVKTIDEYTIETKLLLITITAYNKSGNEINSKQCSVFIAQHLYYDPRDRRVYPAVAIGKLLWMRKNLTYICSGARPCSDKEKNGWVYKWEEAKPPLNQSGWRLPGRADWLALIQECGGEYNNLAEGGDSGFDACLGGFIPAGLPQNRYEGQIGRYWSEEHDSFGSAENITFNSISGEVYYNEAEMRLDKKSYLSVRYVKDIRISNNKE